MALWSLDDWHYLDRRVVTDPKGRQWSVALMDVLGQKGDPDRPSAMAELEYASGRYFTLIYSGGGGLRWERGYPTLPEATTAYERLLAAVIDGRVDPSQPVFRESLDDE
jgi:hypothetical protein